MRIVSAFVVRSEKEMPFLQENQAGSTLYIKSTEDNYQWDGFKWVFVNNGGGGGGLTIVGYVDLRVPLQNTLDNKSSIGAGLPSLLGTETSYIDTVTGIIYIRPTNTDAWAVAYTPIQGNTITSASGAPTNPPPGIAGDIYIDTDNGDYYVNNGTIWSKRFNIQGSIIYSGPSSPAGLSPGKEGDYYLNSTTGELHGPRSGDWNTAPILNLVGSQILSGAVNPNIAAGLVGDYYINTTTNTLFGPKTATSWGVGVPLVGPPGADGPAGLGVPPGGATGQVLSKIDNTDNNTEWTDPSGGGGGIPEPTVDGMWTRKKAGAIYSWAPSGAANVQSDWDETTPTDDAFILNKPTIPSSVTVEDSLTSSSTADALSANQGKVLKGIIDAIKFLTATDTPNDYAGEAGKVLVVNDTEDAIEFIDIPPTVPVDITWASLLLTATASHKVGRVYKVTDEYDGDPAINGYELMIKAKSADGSYWFDYIADNGISVTYKTT